MGLEKKTIWKHFKILFIKNPFNYKYRRILQKVSLYAEYRIISIRM